MELLTATNIIPSYSLAQSNKQGAEHYLIFKTGSEAEIDKSLFLVPHRKDYYMFALLRSGGCRHWVDMVPYDFRPDTLYFTTPPQVHLKENMVPMEGIMICFTEDFLTLNGGDDVPKLPVILNQQNGHVLKLSPDDFQFVEDILNKSLGEFQSSGNWRNNMLHSYLQVLLIYLSRLYTQQFEHHEHAAERSLLRRYQELITEHYTSVHDVASYAELLHITAGHLSDVIKQQSGKSAIELIHDRLLIEAKRLLFHTDQSVKELSFQLGFSDVSYFVRFFKRLSGLTPVEFRTQIREKYHPNLQV